MTENNRILVDYQMENRVEDSIGRELISFLVSRGLLGSNIFVFLVNFSASLFSEFKFIFT